MDNGTKQIGRTKKGFLIIASFLLLVLPLILVVVQQQQELRQRASELSFKTLPPGSPLPTDEECATRVRRATWEPRPINQNANATNVYSTGYRLVGSELAQFGPGYEDKVTGNFTGTTDEIIQWAACKWGFDENTVRAQAAVESSWRQTMLGTCLGGNVQTETGGCHSVGLMQVKAANIPPAHPGTWPYAKISTSFNIDYTLAVRRACFEGKLSLPGVGYQAGDEWGCIGQWNTGAWHNPKSEQYISKVKQALANNAWNFYGAGPLPTIPVVTEAVPTLSTTPSEEPTVAPSTVPTGEPTTVPTIAVSPTSPYVVPTFFCLAAPCPITPSVEPSVTGDPSPTPTISSTPEPTSSIAPSEEVPTISAEPTEDPCASSASLAHSKKGKKDSKHKGDQGGVSKFMEQLLKFFMELITLLLKLIGANPVPNPNPTPVPTQSVSPTTEPEPSDEPTDEPEPSTDPEPTIDPCAQPTAEPSEEPQPTEPEVSVTVSPGASVSPSIVVVAPTTSGIPSGTTQPSQTTSPSAVPSNVTPSEDPCAASTSLAGSKKHKSKHKGHNGIITKFMKFLLEFFIRIFRMIGLTPGNPTPVPSPIPTVSAPTITDGAVLTLAPTQTETPTVSSEPTEPAVTESTSPTVEPTPCGGADTAVISGKVTTDSRYFTTINIGITDATSQGQVRTHTINNPFANRDYAYSFANLHPDKTYLVSIAACRTENSAQVCSKPMEIINCSGTIDAQEIACRIAGTGTADFAVKRTLLPSGSPVPSVATTPAVSESPSASPAPSTNATPTVFFNLQRGR